jgi:hypothetical protein
MVKIASFLAAKSVFLQFDGVASMANVYEGKEPR